MKSNLPMPTDLEMRLKSAAKDLLALSALADPLYAAAQDMRSLAYLLEEARQAIESLRVRAHHVSTLPQNPPVVSPTNVVGALSVPQAAKMVGVCQRTVYNLMRSGALPWVKIGARRLVLVDDLRALLAAHRHHT